MKAKLIITLMLFMLILTSCETHKQKSDKNLVSDLCREYADDYEIIEENNDGMSVVSVTAPDFEKVLEITCESKEIDEKVLKEAIDKYPEYKKEYIFSAEKITKTEIEKAFLEQVSYELIIKAIDSNKYEEEWGTEE